MEVKRNNEGEGEDEQWGRSGTMEEKSNNGSDKEQWR